MASYFKAAHIFYQGLLIYRDLRKYLRNNFSKDLHFPEALNNEYFYHSSYYNRTRQYMHTNHFFGELLCLLRGEKMNHGEYEKFALLSACAPIFDDFFEKNFNLHHILKLLQSPETTPAQNPAEQLSVHFLLQILQKTSNNVQFKNAALELFHAQILSKNQPKNILRKQLLENSLNKGGYSGLMYALLLDNPITPGVEKLGFLLGGYGQLMDDIFDIYDDARSEVQTFANQSNTVLELRAFAEEHEQKILEVSKTIAIDSKAWKRFLEVHYVFASMIEIALWQFERIEKKKGIGPSQCLSIPRKNWIIDMENPLNIFRLFRLAAHRLQRD